MPRSAYYILCGMLIAAPFQPIASGADAKKEKRPVVITGDRVRTKLMGIEKGIKRYLTVITGHPRITSGSVIIRSEQIIITGKDGERAECRGRVRLIDRKNRTTVLSRTAIFLRDVNRIDLTGAPRIVSRRDDNSKVDLRANRIEYHIDDEMTRAHGNVRLSHKEMRVRSGSATYSRDDAIVKFMDSPVIRKERDTFRADLIRYDVSKRIVYLENNVALTTYSEEKHSEKGTRWVPAHTTGDAGEYHEKDRRMIIRGNAVVEREDAVFRGSVLEIWGEHSEYARGTDVQIHYTRENLDARGEQFRYYKNRNVALLWGDPVIIVKGKDDSERARVYGDFMEFYQDSDELFISGNVRVHRQAETLQGSLARYLRRKDLMYIYGNPTVQRGSSRFMADRILFNTRSRNARLIGNIRGSNVR